MTNPNQFQTTGNAYLQMFNQALANYELVSRESKMVKPLVVKSKLISKIKRRIARHT